MAKLQILGRWKKTNREEGKDTLRTFCTDVSFPLQMHWFVLCCVSVDGLSETKLESSSTTWCDTRAKSLDTEELLWSQSQSLIYVVFYVLIYVSLLLKEDCSQKEIRLIKQQQNSGFFNCWWSSSPLRMLLKPAAMWSCSRSSRLQGEPVNLDTSRQIYILIWILPGSQQECHKRCEWF